MLLYIYCCCCFSWCSWCCSVLLILYSTIILLCLWNFMSDISVFAIKVVRPKFTQKIPAKEQRTLQKAARNFPDERTIWTELRSRFICASAVHTIGLHAPSFIPRPKPRNQGNEGQPGCTDTERARTRSATETQHKQPARDSGGELAAAAAAPPPPTPPPLLLLLLLCCC